MQSPNLHGGACIELLEDRRLLAFIVSGTTLADSIVMSVGGGTITVMVNGSPVTRMDAAESEVVINGLDGGDIISIDNTGDNSVTINGGNGNDTIRLAPASDLIAAISSPVHANGDADSNTIIFSDLRNFFTGNTHTLTPTTYAAADSATVTYAGFGELHLFGGEEPDIININGTAANSANFIRPNRDSDGIFINETGTGSYVSIDPTGNSGIPDGLSVNPDGVGTAVVYQQVALLMGATRIHAGGTLRLREGGIATLQTYILDITGTGTLDVVDNGLVVLSGGPPSPLLQIQSWISTGYNAGSWTGSGITSSLAAITSNGAVGYAESSALPTIPPIFEASGSSSVHVRYTIYGDADLSGDVDSDDFNRQAAAFGTTNRPWSDGNFNFDALGLVSSDDFNLLASNFGLAAAAAGDSVLRAQPFGERLISWIDPQMPLLVA